MMVFRICLFIINIRYVRVKKDKGTDYVLRWKSKGAYTSKPKQLYTAFLHSIKLSEYKIGTKFDKGSFTVE